MLFVDRKQHRTMVTLLFCAPRSPFVNDSPTQPSVEDMQQRLRTVEAAIGAASDTSISQLVLLRRDAVYAALDVNELATAMQHALACMDLARASGDSSLQATAHVALALVLCESYDDLGAAEHFHRAEQLSRASGDVRGVALVATNAAHYEMERAAYGAAVERLHALLDSPQVGGLELGETRDLINTFHVNYVISASEALMASTTPPGQHDRTERQVQRSAAFLWDLKNHPSQLTHPARMLDVIDALTRFSLLQAALALADRLATERVLLAKTANGPVLYGRALLDRARVYARSEQWSAAIADAETAVAEFERAGHELLAIRAREAAAEGYARTGRFREAFEAQREVTRRVELLYRQYYQQRAVLGQLEQQAHAAEVRAAAFREASLRDPLTGAPNRTFAMQVLARLHDQAKQGRSSAVALMDLDHFKHVNDTFGHVIGDTVLTRVSRTLTSEIRDMDCFARFGGEEFIVILDGADLNQAREACERLRRTLEDTRWDDIMPSLRVTGSFGVALLDTQSDLKTTLQDADDALYAAKAAGRNTVHVSARDVTSRTISQ